VTPTPVSSFGYVFLASVIGSIAAVFLKTGAGRLHRNVSSLIFNFHLYTGVGLYLLSSLFFLKGIKHGELSILYPMTSLSYVWAFVWSRMFFSEHLNRQKMLGLAMIMGGVVYLFVGTR
jgi:drug/metabolite transporter (DMT)-like permease